MAEKELAADHRCGSCRHSSEKSMGETPVASPALRAALPSSRAVR